MKYKIIFVASIITSSSALFSIDNPHFYRATNMLPEPRIEHDYLSTFDATLGGGSTRHGRAANGHRVPLFDIYGIQNMQTLNLNTTFTNPNNFYDELLNNLAALPARSGFANLSIEGRFRIIESNLSFTQNLAKGLLLFFYLPVRQLKIGSVTFTDLSPSDTIIPNRNSPQWQAVFHNLFPLLAYYGIDANSAISSGLGDLTSCIGWTRNYQDTETLDFIDFTVMTGFLAPTGKQRNENKLFSLPTGYNGHWGFPLYAAGSIGFFEWATIGAYMNSLFFLNKLRSMRIKTDAAQSGIIKLAHTRISDHRGSLVDVGLYVKADHIGHGVSVTAAYSFASQQKSHVTPLSCPSPDVTTNVINNDATLAGWNMHTLNFSAEYDCAREGESVGNRIGIFYNLQVAGKRVFDTNVVGGLYGIDISWSL